MLFKPLLASQLLMSHHFPKSVTSQSSCKRWGNKINIFIEVAARNLSLLFFFLIHYTVLAIICSIWQFAAGQKITPVEANWTYSGLYGHSLPFCDIWSLLNINEQAGDYVVLYPYAHNHSPNYGKYPNVLFFDYTPSKRLLYHLDSE